MAPESGRECLPVLSAGERERAQRMMSLPARHQFIVARAKLRWLLGGYLGADPSRIEITAGTHGKPRLADDGGSRLEFNVSHSRGVLLIGVATGRPVGVDVEHVRAVGDLAGLARVALGPAEQAQLHAPADARARLTRFFQLWTRKEARLKASGEGIVAGLAADSSTGADDARRWSTRDLALGRGVIGAVVVMQP